MAKVDVEPGQLRRWVVPDHPRDKDKLFLIIGPAHTPPQKPIPGHDHPTWNFVIDGRMEWHFDDVIFRDSEVVE